MSVLCPTCGKQSQDPEFCDHCNADLGTSAQTARSLPPERCPLNDGGVALSAEQRHALLFPESAATLHTGGTAWRVHWISSQDGRERGPALQKRLSLQLAALPSGRILDEGQGRWLAFEAAQDAAAWLLQSPLSDPLAELQRLSAALHSLAFMLESLHQNSLVWLNFDPNSLEDAGPLERHETPAESAASPDWRRLRITNLDVELFPFQSMPERVRVHPHYAAPEVVQFRVDDIGPRTDVFHLAMFAYYWLAQKLPDGLAGNGLESHDYVMPSLRVFAPTLPEGIAPVIARGIATSPGDRHATPQALVHALDEAIINAHRRRAHAGPARWDISGCTTVGRSKAEQPRGNEDAVVVKDDGSSALALVADGVSTCDIGSGGLASTMACIAIESAFADGSTHDTFPAMIADATRSGSESLLEWAFAHDCRAELEAGRDLMGTTLTVAWLEGREISIANLGDSRAYLNTDDGIEQLTVDGDLASDLLARGASPEEVKELGTMARALRECVGGCAKNEQGEIAILPESCSPKVARWPLAPGDIYILCTDGLVEEGFFLEPATVARLVKKHKDRSAADLARLLLDAADAMQRVPSILEPDGFGDNISCVVIKIKE